MSVASISTYAAYQSTLNDVSKLETTLNTEQEQLSSGNQSQNFEGMADQTQQYLSVSNVLARTNQYLADNQVVETRVNSTSNSLDQITTIANSLQSLIAQRRTGTSDNSAFAGQLQGLWQQMSDALNVQVDGQYLFSGTKTNVAPVDGSTFPSATTVGTPDSTYYKGSTQDVTVRASDSSTITYNVRADNPAIQQLVAGLVAAKQADQDNSDTEFAQAYNLVQSGTQGVIAAQATVNANKVSLSDIDQNHQTLQLYWQGIQQTLGNTDIVSVSTQVAVNQGILQAAFQAFAKINSLRLSDYLK